MENINAKFWWQSKTVWLGVLQTMIGILLIVADFLQKGNFSPSEATLLVTGILTVVLRIWFTDSAIAK